MVSSMLNTAVFYGDLRFAMSRLPDIRCLHLCRESENTWGHGVGLGLEKGVIPYPLVICYVAIENGPFIVDFPMKNGDFP